MRIKKRSPSPKISPQSPLRLPQLREQMSLKVLPNNKKLNDLPVSKLQRSLSHAVQTSSKRGISINQIDKKNTQKNMTESDDTANKILELKLMEKRDGQRLQPLTQSPSALSKSFKQPAIDRSSQFDVQTIQTSTDYNRYTNNSLVLGQIETQGLLTHDARRYIPNNKMYKQELLGDLSALWWNVVDSIFGALEKTIKIRVDEGKNKNNSELIQMIKDSPNKVKKQMKNHLKGTVESNIKVSLEFAKLYSNLEIENYNNYKALTKYFQDFTHLSIILQALFYEKVVIYLLGSINKWDNQQEILCIHSLALDLIPVVISCRKLMIQILIEQVQNSVQDSKVRKPKYISREKKLIQISKFINFVRNDYEKYLNILGSPNRYKVFKVPNFKDLNTLVVLEQKWRNLVFNVPMSPFITEKTNKKYLLVMEPLNILYKHNKRQEHLQIDYNSELFLDKLSQEFSIVLFTAHEKESSLLNFIGSLDKNKVLGVLDKNYLTYLEGKPHKNISKVCASFPRENILVLDEKSNLHLYRNSPHMLLVIEGSHNNSKVIKLNGRLFNASNQNEDYLLNLAQRMIHAARNGGKWDLIVEKMLQK